MIRIGQSTDTHRLKDGAELYIGGLLIPHSKGSVGHSDADCLLHTVAESLIGALSMGDLGSLFPDTDEKYKGIESSILVRDVLNRVKKHGFRVVNIDSTIHLQQPKLRSYILEIRQNIALLLDIDIEFVSVKATTGEHIGIVGREEAIVCESVVLITNE